MLQKTKIMNHYIVGFTFRLLIFVFAFAIYCLNREGMYELLRTPVWLQISPLHILWIIFMVTMLSHIFPTKHLPMALRKYKRETFCEEMGYSKTQLLEYVQKQNIRAWTVMLVWLSFNACFGLLYLLDIIEAIDLIMLSIFYYLSDYICILFYCPFQSIIMKNKCCVNCRIYDWGHFMMFTPMLFIKNFYSWSLFFTSIIVLIHWEIYYAKYPERFWEGSNRILQCGTCKDRNCQMKRFLNNKK